MKESILYKKISNQETLCQTCSHFCLVKPKERGLCGVRENQKGKLYALNYGKIIAQQIDPIEKKPIYRFLPNTLTYSIATVGCNFSCRNCQNWDISQNPKPNEPIFGNQTTPEEIIQQTIKNNCPSISYTYTEPTVFLEFALDIMKLAKKERIKNIWVSNGFMSPQTLKLIIPYLDAINVDLKSFDNEFYNKYCGAKLIPVLNNLKTLKKEEIHLEITTLIIPELTDQEKNLEKIAQFIKDELSPETPWHISRFSPQISWQLQDSATTPLESIEKASQIGRKIGLKYVYKGNI